MSKFGLGEKLVPKKVSMDDFFSTQEMRDLKGTEIKLLYVELLEDFPDHPFKVEYNDAMKQLVASIEEKGVIEPIIVRPSINNDGHYQIISGHRRTFACKYIGITDIPAIVKNIDDDTATIMMVDSNIHRPEVSLLELARAYKMRLEAAKRQGKRTDMATSCQVGTKLRTDETLAEEYGISARQLQRIIRLNFLIPDLAAMVDSGSMALNPAVEISYLREAEQELLYRIIDEEQACPSHSQAIRLHKGSEHKVLTYEAIKKLMKEEKPNQKEVYSFKRDRIKKYIPAEIKKKNDIEDFVIKALEFYAKNHG